MLSRLDAERGEKLPVDGEGHEFLLVDEFVGKKPFGHVVHRDVLGQHHRIRLDLPPDQLVEDLRRRL